MQNWPTSPTTPSVFLNATSLSPISWTRTGAQSGEGTSSDRRAGIQYRRKNSPAPVPLSVRVNNSLSAWGSIANSDLIVAQGSSAWRSLRRFVHILQQEAGGVYRQLPCHSGMKLDDHVHDTG